MTAAQGNRVSETSDFASIFSGAVVPGRPAGASRHKAITREVTPAFSRRAARDDRPADQTPIYPTALPQAVFRRTT
jgi:hypothetical protein